MRYGTDLARDGGARNPRVRQQSVEAVHATRHEIDLCLNAGLRKSPRIVKSLVAQHVVLRDGEVGGRDTTEAVSEGGYGVPQAR